MSVHPQTKLPVDTGQGGHHNCRSYSASRPSACPFKSVVGALEDLYLAMSAIPLLRGVPVGVVHAGNNVIVNSEVFPPRI